VGRALALLVGDGEQAARALYYLGGLALLGGDAAGARQATEEALQRSAESGETSWSSHLVEMRGRALVLEGRLAEAGACIGESLAALQAIGSKTCLPHSLEAAARVLLARGAAVDAALLLGASSAVCERLGIAMLPVERSLAAQTLAAARERLGAESLGTALRDGAGLAEADAYAAAERACAGAAGHSFPHGEPPR
jgi:hypothetical protein